MYPSNSTAITAVPATATSTVTAVPAINRLPTTTHYWLNKNPQKVEYYIDGKYLDDPNQIARIDWSDVYNHIFSERKIPAIINVIYNDPATIVFWSDGTKTVVKASHGDKFVPEVGLAMAITKKALGNKGNYYKQFKKWLPKEE